MGCGDKKYGALYNWYAAKGIVASRIADWYLGSAVEMYQMFLNLKSNNLGGFISDGFYWSSTEYSATVATTIHFTNGSAYSRYKNDSGNLNDPQVTDHSYVRACRSFTTTTIYSLGDVGPAGGWIFYITYNGGGSFTYLESAPSDCASDVKWSNIYNTAIGTTSWNIGTGQLNTAKIIAQAGHIMSAAKLCNDLIT